jgi:quinol monooxygenase YgiN
MHIVHVHVRVKPEFVDAFLQASLENARNSIQEPGIARFDVLQDTTDPSRFVLMEAYCSPDAPAAHRETAHYLKWRDTVEDMMSQPRERTVYKNAFPPDRDW